MPQLVAWFASATVVLFLGTSVAIFGFGYYEPGWGREYALKLALFIGIALTALSTHSSYPHAGQLPTGIDRAPRLLLPLPVLIRNDQGESDGQA